jgi:DNA replication protein DnaC
MSTAIATIEQARTTCKTCGQTFFYEPILFGKVDLGLVVNTRCERCEQKAQADEDARRNRERQAVIEGQIRAQIPPDLLATEHTHPEFNRELWAGVRSWRPGSEFWLGIIGQSGLCKTRCMALLAMRAMRAGVRVTWSTANRLKDAASDRTHRERTVSLLARQHLEDCLHGGWLFLDDLGKNEWSPAFESQFFQILDHRKNHRLPLVFSSNCHPEGFSQLISGLNSAPIIGRLLDRTTLIDLTE